MGGEVGRRLAPANPSPQPPPSRGGGGPCIIFAPTPVDAHPVNDADIAALVRDGMLVTLKIGGPLLAVALLSGLLVALVQAVTQINEATLAFVPKLLVIGITLIVLGPFMFATLSSYTLMLFDRMIAVGGS